MKRSLPVVALLLLTCSVVPFLARDPEVSPLAPIASSTVVEPADALATVERQPVVAPASAPAGLFAAAVGTALRFHCTARLLTWVTNRGARNVGMDCQLDGSCAWTVLARQNDEILTAVLLSEVKLTGVGDAGARRLALEFAKPAVVRFRGDGAVLGIRFHPDMDPGAHNWMRSLVSGARFVARVGERSWIEDELHNDGPRRMRYSWEPTAGVADSLVKESVPDVAGGTEIRPTGFVRGRATFDRAVGWLSAMQCEETQTVDFPDAKMRLETAFSCSFALRDQSVVTTPAADWVSPFADMDGRASADAALTRQRNERLRMQLTGVTAAGLLQRLAAQGNGPDDAEPTMSATVELLVLWLQQNPQALTELKAALLTGAFGNHAELAAAIALGRCGLAAADEFLLGCVELRHGASLQQAAVRSVFAQSKVSRSLALGIGRLALECRDPAVANASLLACGSAVEGVDAAARTEALQCLRALEGPARARGELYSWFEAVGNAGAPEAVGWIEPYRVDADPALAADCLLGLRRVPGEAAMALLVVATADPVAAVRRRAAEVLGERTEPAATAALAALVATEADGSVLRTAIDGLARRLPASAAENALRRLTSEHAATEVRDLASAALAAMRRG